MCCGDVVMWCDTTGGYTQEVAAPRGQRELSAGNDELTGTGIAWRGLLARA